MSAKTHPAVWSVLVALVAAAPLDAQAPVLVTTAKVPEDIADRGSRVELEVERSFTLPDGRVLAYKQGMLELRERGVVQKTVPWSMEVPEEVVRDSATGLWLLIAPPVIRELKADLSLGTTFSYDDSGFGSVYYIRGIETDADSLGFIFANAEYSGGGDGGATIEVATLWWKRSQPDVPTLSLKAPDWRDAEAYKEALSRYLAMPISLSPYSALPASAEFEKTSIRKRVYIRPSWSEDLYWNEDSLDNPSHTAWKLDTRVATKSPARGVMFSSAPFAPGASVAIRIQALSALQLALSWTLPDGTRGSGALNFSAAPFADLVDARKTTLTDFRSHRDYTGGIDVIAYVGEADSAEPNFGLEPPTLSLETDSGALWLVATAVQPGPMEDNDYWESRILLADPSGNAKAPAWFTGAGMHGPVFTTLIPRSMGEELLIDGEEFMGWGPSQAWLATRSGSSDLLIRSFVDGKPGEPWFAGSGRRLAEPVAVFANRGGSRLLAVYRHGIADLYAVAAGKSLSWIRAINLLDPLKSVPGAFDTAPFAGLPTATISSGFNLRLRSAAGTGSAVIGSLPFGTLVQILENGPLATIDDIEAPWTKVKSATGQEGWVFGGYLKSTR